VTVLILTDADDPTATRVMTELDGRGVPAVRVAPADFPTRIGMTARIGRGQPWAGALTDLATGRTLVELDDVRSVYYRRPNQFQVADGLSGPERVFAYGEARIGFGGVLQALRHCLWINDPVAAARAEYKPVQLAAAAECGLRVPATIISNEPEHAHRWAADLARPIIYKPMSGIWHHDEGQRRVLYTSPVIDLDSVLEPGFATTTHLLQEQVAKAYEARVMVIGDEVLAVAIHTTSEKGRVDWRADYDSHAYEVIDLPTDLRGKLLDLHQRLGLVFGAADLIRTPDGGWVFLETNQCGEWGWLAAATDLPITQTFADLLQKGTDR
jgi:ATP-grasp ribosomal peptide maturase